MKLLLDTHTFLWFVAGSTELSSTARKLIENTQNEKFVSIVTLWEISIKNSLGKLTLNGAFDSVLDDVKENGFEILPISFAHVSQTNTLLFHHKDPFDRMLIAQAISENIQIVGKDEIFDMYFEYTTVKRIW